MKIIEGMKEVKRIEEKIGDLRKKVQTYCADLDFETPVYQNQAAQVDEWMQSIHDSIKEAMRLRIAINKTNLATTVAIELGGNKVSHSIAEWILRRRIYAEMEMNSWTALTDRSLKEGITNSSTGEKIVVKIRRYFDPLKRDKKIDEYRSESGIVDRTLEVVNATTDLME